MPVKSLLNTKITWTFHYYLSEDFLGISIQLLTPVT